LIRPFLSWAGRAWTEEYCRERGFGFRHDAMNDDERFARVRERKELLPLLRSFNPRVVEALLRTARLLRDDASALNAAAAELLAAAAIAPATADDLPALSVAVLSASPVAVRRRALRQWIAAGRGDLRRLETVHLLAVEGLLAGERGGRTIELPGGASVSRKRGQLLLQAGPSQPRRA
jgi:tRNA(Ile)-lysidine synthase